jgi:hypothetical protein
MEKDQNDAKAMNALTDGLAQKRDLDQAVPRKRDRNPR